MNRVRLACVMLLCGALLSLAFIGCTAKSRPKTSETDAETQRKETVVEIEDQLRSALFQLQPEHLNIDSRLDDAVSVLNNWWAAIDAANMRPTGLQPAEIPADRIPAELLARLKRDSFDSIDGQHIRACYLAQRISEQATSGARTEAERVLKVFQWVCRNIALRDADEVNYPVGMYEALIIGRGTPADRTQVIAAILKQLRIDSAIVSPREASDDNAPWLLGVVLQDQLLLFDTRLGLAVPSGTASWDDFLKPASLSEVLEHPEWLQQLRTSDDEPYPITAEQLQNPRVEAISFPDGWSPRIWALEQLLPGEFLCVLYDAPGTIDQLPGVFERVASAVPGQDADAIGLWDYPHQLEQRMRATDANQFRALQAAFTPFIVPVEFERDPDTGKVQRTESLRQLRIRTEQLFGKRNDSVGQYVTIRQLSVMQPPDPALMPVYQRAADDAFYFSSVCKFENGEYDSTEKLLNDYLKRYRRTGQWADEARLLLAETHLAQGEVEEALQALRVQESDDPYRDRLAIMARVWTKTP